MNDTVLTLGIDARPSQAGAQQFSRSIDEIKTKASQGTKATDQVSGSFERMKTAAFGLRSVLGAIGIAVSASAFIGLTRNAINAADALNDMSKRTDIAVESLSAFDYIAKQNGTSIETFVNGIRFMQRNISQASTGAQEAQQAFAQLGLNFADIAQLSPEQAFIAIADKIDTLATGADRTRAAMDVFGRSATDLIPIMEGGADSIREMVAEAERLGLILGSEDAEKIARFNDAWDRTIAVLQSVARDGFLFLYDASVYVMDGLSVSFQAGISSIIKFGNSFVAIIEGIYNGVIAAFNGIGDIFSGFASDVANFAANPLGGANFNNLDQALSVGITDRFKKAFDDTIKEAETFNKSLDEELQQRISEIGGAGKRPAKPARTGKLAPASVSGGVDSVGSVAGGAASRGVDALRQEANRIYEQTRSPFERYDAEIRKLDILREKGLLTQDTYERAITKYKSALDDALKVSQSTGEGIENVFSDVGRAIFDNVGGALADAFLNGKKGALDLADVMRRVFAQAAGSLLQQKVFEPIFDSISSAIFGSATGNVLQGGNITAFANGGVVNSPTYFPMARGTGVAGEAGEPEGILPLRRGANGKLGVYVTGSDSASVNTSVVVNISNNGNASGDSRSESEVGRMLGERVRGVVQEELLKQMRPGGLLKQQAA